MGFENMNGTTMRWMRSTVAVVAVIGAVGLAGCSGSPEPTETVGTPKPSIETSASPSTGAKPSSATASAAPTKMPEAAKKQTKEGALAFLDYYTARVNALYAKPSEKGIAEIKAMSDKGCKWCASMYKGMGDLADKGQTTKATLTIRDAVPQINTQLMPYLVKASYSLRGRTIVDQDGGTVERHPDEGGPARFVLTWKAGQWLFYDWEESDGK